MNYRTLVFISETQWFLKTSEFLLDYTCAVDFSPTVNFVGFFFNFVILKIRSIWWPEWVPVCLPALLPLVPPQRLNTCPRKQDNHLHKPPPIPPPQPPGDLGRIDGLVSNFDFFILQTLQLGKLSRSEFENWIWSFEILAHQIKVRKIKSVNTDWKSYNLFKKKFNVFNWLGCFQFYFKFKIFKFTVKIKVHNTNIKLQKGL